MLRIYGLKLHAIWLDPQSVREIAHRQLPFMQGSRNNLFPARNLLITHNNIRYADLRSRKMRMCDKESIKEKGSCQSPLLWVRGMSAELTGGRITCGANFTSLRRSHFTAKRLHEPQAQGEALFGG